MHSLRQITPSWLPHLQNEDEFNKCSHVDSLSDSENIAVDKKRQLMLTIHCIIKIPILMVQDCYREEIK